MIVRGLPAHVSPHKLFDDFPQAATPTGQRLVVVPVRSLSGAQVRLARTSHSWHTLLPAGRDRGGALS